MKNTRIFNGKRFELGAVRPTKKELCNIMGWEVDPETMRTRIVKIAGGYAYYWRRR